MTPVSMYFVGHRQTEVELASDGKVVNSHCCSSCKRCRFLGDVGRQLGFLSFSSKGWVKFVAILAPAGVVLDPKPPLSGDGLQFL
jgi:hypothetical protein